MRIDIMTLFPEMCERVLDESIIGRARRNGIISVQCHNIRDYTCDKHRHVDDMPYGGGQGMLMKPEPINACFSAISAQCTSRPVVHTEGGNLVAGEGHIGGLHTVVTAGGIQNNTEAHQSPFGVNSYFIVGHLFIRKIKLLG